MNTFLIGFFISLIISTIGYIKKSLTLSGSISAIIIGTLIYYTGGLFFSSIIVAFFISSSVITKISKILGNVEIDVVQKGGQRDYKQVMANGLLGLIFALLFHFTKNHIFILAYSTAFAAAASDTWASEIGVLSKGKPVSIIGFKHIERGMSGGISLLGIIASILGSGFISVIFLFGFFLNYGFSFEPIIMFILCAFGGFAGSIIDSLLGATLQVKYKCPVCNKITEKTVHHGSSTLKVSGMSFIDNDIVNFISPLSACLIVISLYQAVLNLI